MIYFSRCFENSDNYVTRYIIALGRNSLLLFALNGKTSQLVMYFYHSVLTLCHTWFMYFLIV